VSPCTKDSGRFGDPNLACHQRVKKTNEPAQVTYFTKTMPSHPTSFVWNASDYNKSSAAQQQWANELIAKLSLRGNERVLDIGCGDGKVTAIIARSVPDGSVVGVDNSEEMIRFARDHFPRDRFPGLSFIQMDARCLAFDEKFDVIFSNAALHWICDHHDVLAGIRNCLLPGGRLLIQMGGKGNAAAVLEIFEETLCDPAWKPYFIDFSFSYGFFSPEEYRQWLAEAGLHPLRVELIRKDMTYQTREEFAGWIRTTWLPYLQRIPENLRPTFISTIVDRYLFRYPADREGIIHIGMVRLEVEAVQEV
jgi:trans-aconitate methyltransferase